jgi:hypothetical protein
MEDKLNDKNKLLEKVGKRRDKAIENVKLYQERYRKGVTTCFGNQELEYLHAQEQNFCQIILDILNKSK